jgi:hypothetical protein
MRELMVDVEDSPGSLLFVVVRFVPFIAANIRRPSVSPSYPFGGRLNCGPAVRRGCYPAIHFQTLIPE